MNSERFYSEFGEDRWIAEHLPLPATGFYVDVGCAHPTEGSNTAFLRDRGWQGLAIDANPGYAPLWPAGAFVQAIVSTEPIVGFEFKSAHYESRVCSGQTQFAAVPLQSLVRAHRRRPFETCDFLTLDVEGHEFEALLSLGALLPPIIVSEYNTRGLGEDMRVHDYLLKNGFTLVHTTTANHIFHRA